MNKTVNQKAWFLVLPVLVLVAFSAVIPLDGHFITAGRTQLGVRPEFIRLTTDDDGIPARVTRVEDVGRHKIIRLDVDGHPVSAIADEGEAIPEGAGYIAFDPQGINVYADDWRVAAQGEAT